MTRGDCSTCPAMSGLGGIPCAADVRSHYRFCELARENPTAYVPQIVRLSRADAAAGRVLRAEPSPDPGEGWTPHAGPLDPRRELVVARYREDVAWTAAVGFNVRVYNAGPEIASPAPHVTVIPKPNAGREEHAYLTHLVNEYDSLTELTFFAQGHPWDHAPDILARLRPAYDAPTSLTTRYLEGHPPGYVKAHDKVETHHGFPVRYGDAGIKQHGEGHERGWFNPRAWDAVFAVPRPAPQWFAYGAMWATPWWAIRRRPLSFWRWLLSQCEAAGGATSSWSDPPLNAWAMEALWLYLWMDPVEYPHRPECHL